MSDFGKCPICREYGFLDTHKCGRYYLIRREDDDRTEEHKQYATSADQAAERWLERNFSNWDYPTSMTFLVVDVGETTEWKITVEVEAVPSFSSAIDEEKKLESVEVESE